MKGAAYNLYLHIPALYIIILHRNNFQYTNYFRHVIDLYLMNIVYKVGYARDIIYVANFFFFHYSSCTYITYIT